MDALPPFRLSGPQTAQGCAASNQRATDWSGKPVLFGVRQSLAGPLGWFSARGAGRGTVFDTCRAPQGTPAALACPKQSANSGSGDSEAATGGRGGKQSREGHRREAVVLSRCRE